MDKKSTQMTLAEIRQLCLVDTQADPDKCEPVATLEEYLDTARGQIKLFIELKGETADAQMVDDVVALVRARGMEHQVALTSLERDVIAYADRVYPEMETVYVSFVGFGELGSLPGDILGLEETAMTGNALLSIHNSGKRAIVWTPNTRESLTKYMREEVDILYTDEPTLAAQIQDELDRESPREKILDFLLGD